MYVAVVLAFSCAAAQILPDPPQVTVDKATLQQFGVFLDVNQPGTFDRLMSITPSVNSSNPQIRQQATDAKNAVQNIYRSILDMSAVQISRSIIAIYRPLPEGPLAQFISAHILNMYNRLFNILNDIDDKALDALSQLNGIASPVHAQILCQNNQYASIVASNITREIDTTDACSELATMLTEKSTLLVNQVTEVARAKGALNQMNQQLKSETTPLKSVFDFLRDNDVLPKLYQTLLIREVTTKFMDYAAFYNSIENSEQVANVIGMPLPELKSILINKATIFLRDENLI